MAFDLRYHNFVVAVRTYFTNKGYFNKDIILIYYLQHDILNPIVINRSFFNNVLSEGNGKFKMKVDKNNSFSLYNEWLDEKSNKYTDWFMEHIRPFMEKYNISRNEILFL